MHRDHGKGSSDAITLFMGLKASTQALKNKGKLTTVNSH